MVMEPHGLSPWYLHKNTLLRPWAPKRSRLREARYGRDFNDTIYFTLKQNFISYLKRKSSLKS